MQNAIDENRQVLAGLCSDEQPQKEILVFNLWRCYCIFDLCPVFEISALQQI